MELLLALTYLFLAFTADLIEDYPGWESHIKVGNGSYSDLEPRQASQTGLVIGRRLNEYMMAGFQIGFVNRELSPHDGEVNTDGSANVLFISQLRLGGGRLQPYIEGGLGITDPIYGYHWGTKGAFSAALGGRCYMSKKWAILLELQRVIWRQDNARDSYDVESSYGEIIPVVYRNHTIGIAYNLD